jgi:pilus assembly protein Flp/PilA
MSGVAAEGNPEPIERGLDVGLDRTGLGEYVGQEFPAPLEDRLPELAARGGHGDSRDTTVPIVLAGVDESPSREPADEPADRRDLGAEPGGDLGHGCAGGAVTDDHEDTPLGERELEPNGGEGTCGDRDRAERDRFESRVGAVRRYLFPHHRQKILGSMISMRKPKSHTRRTAGGIADPTSSSHDGPGSSRTASAQKEQENGMSTLVGRIAALRHHIGQTEGQGLAEYALILALIAIVAIIALIFLGSQISGILSTVGNSV